LLYNYFYNIDAHLINTLKLLPANHSSSHFTEQFRSVMEREVVSLNINFQENMEQV
jgi:hypothetical protein